MLILPNGNILPCCGLENSENIIVNNVYTSSLREIWNSKEFALYRKERTSFCQECPNVKNKTIGLVESMLRQF